MRQQRTGAATRRRAWVPWAVVATVLALFVGTIAMLGGFVQLPNPPLGDEVRPDADGVSLIETKEWDLDIRSVALEPASAYVSESLVVTARMRNKTDRFAYGPPIDTIVVQIGKRFGSANSCNRVDNGTFPPGVWVLATCTLLPKREGVRLPPKGTLDRVLVAVCDQRHADTLDGQGTMGAGPVKAHTWVSVRDRR